MIWAPFLHWYQPANSEPFFVKEAAEASYLFLVRTLLANRKLKMTWNISGCLIERLGELGYEEVLESVRRLHDRGQVELVGTAAYHPFLPLISPGEAQRQITVQEDILLAYLGVAKPRGFFFPEMGYSPEVGEMVKRLGYEYMILDEMALAGPRRAAGVYEDEATGLKVIIRSRRASNRYVPDYVIKKSKLGKMGNELVITANDAELYGLRHRDVSGSLAALSGVNDLEYALFSELATSSRHRKVVQLRSCSWESSEEELADGQAFAIWKENGNVIQDKLWQLAALAQKAVYQYQDDLNHGASLWHLSRGLASCMFWWASGHDFSRHFGAIAWSPDEVERGLNDLVRSIRSISDKRSIGLKAEAEELNAMIRKELWLAHWRRQGSSHI